MDITERISKTPERIFTILPIEQPIKEKPSLITECPTTETKLQMTTDLKAIVLSFIAGVLVIWLIKK